MSVPHRVSSARRGILTQPGSHLAWASRNLSDLVGQKIVGVLQGEVIQVMQLGGLLWSCSFIINDPAGKHRPFGLNVLADDFQTELIETR